VAAGTIEALGPGMSDWSVGDRIMALVGGGGYAEYAVAHAGHLIPVPEKAAIVSELRAKVLPSLVDRKIVPLVHMVYGLEEAAQAHRDMEASVHFGKIVLSI